MKIVMYILDGIIHIIFGIAKAIFAMVQMFDIFGLTKELKDPYRRNIIEVAEDDLHPERTP